MRVLNVSPDLRLPPEAATETFGLLAVRGAGKSNAARVLAEEMFDAKIPFVAIDPFGAWWGLRASRDAGGPGIPIPIFGGKHGDVPLERAGGHLLADLIVDQRLSCVLDLSRFDSETAKRGFLLDFARRLFERNEEPLHLFLEEADDYIPQKPMREEAQLIRAWQNIVRRGRARGLGMTLITQRSASVSKEVLTQVQTLIAMRTTGPHDTAAIEGWLKYHGQSREILASLAGLEDGEAWVWSPHFLRQTVRVRFRLSRTYDSGATPKMQKAARAPATLADIDLGAIKGRMAATIERAKAEDPRELRHQVAELKRQLAAAASKPAAAPPPAPRPAIEPAQLKRLEAAAARLEAQESALQGGLRKAIDALAQRQQVVVSELGMLRTALDAASRPASRPTQAPAPAAAGPSRPAPRGAAPRRAGGGAEQRILDALAELEHLGAREPERVQVAFLAGYTHLASKGLVNALGALRSAGLVDYPGQGRLALTEAGRARAVAPPRPRSPQELQERVVALLGGTHGRILQPLLDAYPRALPREELGARAGYSHLASKGFVNAIGRLRSLGFIDYPSPGQVVAQPVLFLEAQG